MNLTRYNSSLTILDKPKYTLCLSNRNSQQDIVLAKNTKAKLNPNSMIAEEDITTINHIKILTQDRKIIKRKAKIDKSSNWPKFKK